MTSYVYIAKFGKSACKIGMTDHPLQRLASLKGRAPSPVRAKHGELIALVECRTRRKARSAESALHRRFHEHRIEKEWFWLTSEVQQYCQSAGICSHADIGKKTVIRVDRDTHYKLRVASVEGMSMGVIIKLLVDRFLPRLMPKEGGE